MKRAANKWLMAAFFLLLPSAPLRPQTTLTAFVPEGDSYFCLSSNVRLVLDAKGYMEDGDLNHAQLGPSLQFNIRPFASLKKITIFDLDDMKCMPSGKSRVDNPQRIIATWRTRLWLVSEWEGRGRRLSRSSGNPDTRLGHPPHPR
jgi:hypothetical protein